MSGPPQSSLVPSSAWHAHYVDQVVDVLRVRPQHDVAVHEPQPAPLQVRVAPLPDDIRRSQVEHLPQPLDDPLQAADWTLPVEVAH
eukprot:2017490-Pyramimonas_sp.AAC.1